MNEKYVLITPAYNEEKHIEKTIVSVISQKARPVRYIIVSDGSSDNTDQIARRYAGNYPFIEVFRRDGDRSANFASKVFAFNFGYDAIKHLSFDYIGNLDADVSFEPDYFERLLGKFAGNSRLGIAGGQIYEFRNGNENKIRYSLDSVAGAVMLFRRSCYEDVGGYIPIEVGGEDSTAEIVARSIKWDVQTIPELKVLHLKPLLSGGRTIFHSRFKQGISNYLLGYHPLFQLGISIYRIAEKPFIISSMIFLFGYLHAWLKHKPKILSEKTIAFLRAEQLEKINLFRFFKLKKRGGAFFAK